MKSLNNYVGVIALGALLVIGYAGYTQGWFNSEKK